MRRRRRRGLGSAAHCRLPSDLDFEKCGTSKGMTLCVGDHVTRPLKGKTQHGVVMAVHPGHDNRMRPKLAARVCMDFDEPGDLAYQYLFEELRKPKR